MSGGRALQSALQHLSHRFERAAAAAASHAFAWCCISPKGPLSAAVGKKKKWNWTDNIPILSPRPSPRRSQLDIFYLCTMYFYTQYDSAHMGRMWLCSLELIKWPRQLSQDNNVYVYTNPETLYMIYIYICVFIKSDTAIYVTHKLILWLYDDKIRISWYTWNTHGKIYMYIYSERLYEEFYTVLNVVTIHVNDICVHISSPIILNVYS